MNQRIEPRPPVTCTDNFMNLKTWFFEIREWINKHMDRQTRSTQYFAHLLGQINYENSLQQAVKIMHWLSLLTAYNNSTTWHRIFLDFNETTDDGVAVASAGPYANHLHLASDRHPHQHVVTQFLHAQPTASKQRRQLLYTLVLICRANIATNTRNCRKSR